MADKGHELIPVPRGAIDCRGGFISDFATALAMTGFGILTQTHTLLHPPENGVLLTRHSLRFCHASSVCRAE